MNKKITTSQLAENLNGRLIGKNEEINGIFTTFSDANPGDMVIRHTIDSQGINLAKKKKLSGIITQQINQKLAKIALDHQINIIEVEKIEYANAFALKWSIDKFAPLSRRIVVTGTNGKSTTTHMIYWILKKAGFNAYTNTDSKSEFNTLIDPLVAKQIAELKEDVDALVIEVSEVQGWMDRIMHDHAYLMTKSIDPEIVVLTNVALDHIGLVNSLDEAYKEISGAIRAFKGNKVVLNSEDTLIMKMAKLIPEGVEIICYGNQSPLQLKKGSIYYHDKLLLGNEDLPFQSHHFQQNTLAAIGAALALEIDLNIIKTAVSSYKPLKRRFSILKNKPLIIDDFAHNPGGISETVKSSVKLNKGKLIVVSAIRGSRGNAINQINAESLAESLNGMDYDLIITSSADVVDSANWVQPSEKSIYLNTLQKKNVKYKFIERLEEALQWALSLSKEKDTILLIGAQGMDPASDILKEMQIVK